MKIAYFAASLVVGQDGVSRCVQRMIRGAVERGHDVIAVASASIEGETPVPVVGVPSVVLPLQHSYRLAVPGACHFSKRLREFAPDILHTNSPCTLGFAAVAWGRHARVPVAATYHTHFPAYPRYYRLDRLEDLTWRIVRSYCNSVDRTFVPTRPMLRELQENGVRRLEYLPNGIDLPLFDPSFRSAEWMEAHGSAGRPRILFLSRLVWEKDLRVLAEMHAILRARRDDFDMVVAGDGSARAELEQLMPGARFTGYLSGRALSEAYASCDIFVFPSTTETFGLVTLEAMASGLAPVAARAGGTEELIEDRDTGVLAEPGDARSLADAVCLLLDRPDLRAAVAGRARARAALYSWDAILDRMFDSYRDVIGRAGETRSLRGGRGGVPPRRAKRDPLLRNRGGTFR